VPNRLLPSNFEEIEEEKVELGVEEWKEEGGEKKKRGTIIQGRWPLVPECDFSNREDESQILPTLSILLPTWSTSRVAMSCASLREGKEEWAERKMEAMLTQKCHTCWALGLGSRGSTTCMLVAVWTMWQCWDCVQGSVTLEGRCSLLLPHCQSPRKHSAKPINSKVIERPIIITGDRMF
jgi:hypothetical protein